MQPQARKDPINIKIHTTPIHTAPGRLPSAVAGRIASQKAALLEIRPQVFLGRLRQRVQRQTGAAHRDPGHELERRLGNSDTAPYMTGTTTTATTF
ncbi:hypothetical protein DPMN_147925 [Dreissena polymorpha]|uniref:Uncharacterized protein n=1 Tax=Dreissena polymorpha TaxID=45954 RepID=A0A9D4J3U6_DREPO|nr:hypothetical protein DPMN_147925 [Dreissena polymorpha]